jgi:rhamnosyltransferase
MQVGCVIVTYQPDIELLTRLVESIRQQVGKIYIIDNTPTGVPFPDFKNPDHIEITHLSENMGIAAAQNIGIRNALADNADYVLLSDQDTVFPPSYINDMLPVFSQFSNVAAVVPKFVDTNKSSQDGFIFEHPFLFQRRFPASGNHVIFQAIASGQILKASTLNSIGLMDEPLFIDWVDLEWCWRARKLGFQIIGNADVEISHRLGDGSVNLGFREINIRSPVRHYYITRNAVYLALHSNSLDLNHRITLFLKSFRYLLSFPLLAKPRLQNLKAVTIGFIHGILKVQGEY